MSSKHRFKSLRNAFFTGVVVVLPLGVTVIVINFLLEKLGRPASSLFFGFLKDEIGNSQIFDLSLRFISLLIVLTLVTILGFGSRFFLGRLALNSMEQLLGRVPFINTVYNTVKQIVDTFSQQQKAVFQEVVLIEYPRPGCYAIGFKTSEAKGEVQVVTGQKVVNVFVPTTPNPTSGFLLMIPQDDIQQLKMSVADGMKLIISGGAVVPDFETGDALAIENPKEVKTTKH